jgi:hypothetical protein
MSSLLFRIVDAEVINHQGGRVDILISFGPVRCNVDCRIEEDAGTLRLVEELLRGGRTEIRPQVVCVLQPELVDRGVAAHASSGSPHSTGSAAWRP